MLAEDITEDTVLIAATNRPFRGCSLKKGFAFTAAVFSLFATVAVPYLVLKSVYYLSEGENSDSFGQMIQSGNVGFWVFGPVLSILSLLAIAPFNFYNIYKTVNDSQGVPFTSLKSFVVNFMRILFISSGSVNGFNTNLAYSDVVGVDSGAKRAFQFLLVFNAVLFAGLADSRIVINYVFSEFKRDFRYIKRGLSNLCSRTSFFQMRNQQPITRKALIQSIRKKLDDYYYTVLLGVDSETTNQNQSLFEDKAWLSDPESSQFQAYVTLCDNPFPVTRYVLSDVLGGGLSLFLAYFGNKNVLEFAFNAIVGFFEYCGASSDSSSAAAFAHIFSWVGYIVGILVSYSLIRDLFFRDVCKNKDFSNIGRDFLKKFITIIPALSFGLLNVIMTVMNDSLSPLSKIIVAISAIIGATVVSRYGIEGGLKEFAGKKNVRRELAGLSLSLADKLDDMNTSALRLLATQLGCLSDDSVSLSVIENSDELDDSRNDNTDYSY